MPHDEPPDPDAALEANLRAAACALRRCRQAIAFTGAGISVECGIPPFRSGPAGSPGLWDRYDAMRYGTIDAFRRDPARVWSMFAEVGGLLRRARPGLGHHALARMERSGVLAGVITQNIDGLHQDAGSLQVVELHGSWKTMSCDACGLRVDSRGVSLDHLPPLCPCGGPFRPDVTLFGEVIPAQTFDRAAAMAGSADCLLVVGTSAEVVPAASIPVAAARRGALIIEVNTGETALGASMADLRLEGPAGFVLARLAEQACAMTEN